MAYPLLSRDAFHHRLMAAVESSGCSQTELAKRLGKHQSTVSDWLNPKVRAVPDGEAMMKLPAALHVSVVWLLLGQGSPRDATKPEPPGVMFYRGAEAVLFDVKRMVAELEERWSRDATSAAPAGDPEDLAHRDEALAKLRTKKGKGAHPRRRRPASGQ